MNNLEELRDHCEDIMAISPLGYVHIPASSIIALIGRAGKAEAELSVANEKLHQPLRSFVTDDDISALKRFAECCDDPESGGHDLDVEQVQRLVVIGVLRKIKRNYHETTDFGDYVISAV